MDASLNLANYYFPLLNTLSNKAKLYLATKTYGFFAERGNVV